MTNPIQISKNCWKYTNNYGGVFYQKTSDLKSDLHREDGPAIEWANGYKRWYYNGECIDVNSQEEFEEYLKENRPEVFCHKNKVKSQEQFEGHLKTNAKPAPKFVFQMEFNYSCESKQDLSEEKIMNAFREQIKEYLK